MRNFELLESDASGAGRRCNPFDFDFLLWQQRGLGYAIWTVVRVLGVRFFVSLKGDECD